MDCRSVFVLSFQRTMTIVVARTSSVVVMPVTRQSRRLPRCLRFVMAAGHTIRQQGKAQRPPLLVIKRLCRACWRYALGVARSSASNWRKTYCKIPPWR